MIKGYKFKPRDMKFRKDTVQVDGQYVFALEYECKHAELYAAYESISRSLNCCMQDMSFVNSNREKVGDSIVMDNIRSHYTSLIVNYGRCFASTGRGRVKLEKTIIPKEYHKIHDQLIRLRNDYVAHSGGTNELSINLVVLYPNMSEQKLIYVYAPSVISVVNTNEKFWYEAQEVVLFLYEHVTNKMKTHYKKIDDDIRSIDVSELYGCFNSDEYESFQYSPKFSPGRYQFTFEVKQDGNVYLKGNVVQA